MQIRSCRRGTASSQPLPRPSQPDLIGPCFEVFGELSATSTRSDRLRPRNHLWREIWRNPQLAIPFRWLHRERDDRLRVVSDERRRLASVDLARRSKGLTVYRIQAGRWKRGFGRTEPSHQTRTRTSLSLRVQASPSGNCNRLHLSRS